MTDTYTRQSSFSNGDVIDAPLFTAEFDQLELTFNETTGHNHDGTAGGGASVPFIQKGTSGIYIDTTIPSAHKITFVINGVTVSEAAGTSFGDTSTLTHTPDGGSEGPLNTYLDGLEIAVGDAASDAAAAALSAQLAQNAAMVVGVPVIIPDGGTYVIADNAEIVDVVFEGDGILTLPTVLVKGRRIYARLSAKAVSTKVLRIPTASFSFLGDIGTITAGDNLILLPNESVILEHISTTELEIL